MFQCIEATAIVWVLSTVLVILIIPAIVFQVYLVNTPFLQDIDFETSHCSETEVGFNDK